MNCSTISKCANNLIKTYETNNPFKIAEYLGIDLKYEKLHHLKGFYTYVLRNKYIVINNNIDEISAGIICAHEIGHDRFHRGLGITMYQDETCISLKPSTIEIQANYFAAEFLMPDDKFLELVAQDFTYSQIACTLGVHTDLAIIKAQLLNKKGHNLNVPYVPGANFLGKI
ncbi:ImmA/IrrE family metallo-endopeptidase [Clostridium tagluense]|uniref:ImmA/IrrE family metallo-endopeptidase n=1 Tax=Clostridium tagluense TaxID=360422 RepID=UPI001C6EABDC|nr:ImmA/IrrE family metallo-endopeptidase [Clostridium tagluense]MBW9158801.1 ImmA/IrrE family metallo-endopeptidase [Clostridium tagluense]MCB2312101.1 ImmA/IrrE family metallo-endopeptidase [Clostridium tagluense]MCB2316714.1 ImmA/IrrE family metallo-endopeptidase [Clostridium tagluense]MCB2321546.1 ImmA/IrrE family metallo-endopeptidase [Clostridium tagluense]MCB2326583.1 ImmA/IrrE family metallo-endopeptidase [Clostridium tagluense]